MTAHREILPDYAATPSQRSDGWTADRQRVFLQALSEGSSVTHACTLVGLSIQSAYAFRRAARGAGFALGWQAAQLLSREVLADTLMDRALHGVDERRFHTDGSETRYRRHDNVLAFKMLTRMDRMADTAHAEATHAAARLVAGEFDQYLDLIGRDAGPARAGLFLGARLGAPGVPAGEDDLAPIRTLARADHWLRTHTDLAEPLATADLDPAARASWTAEQWARAEAAGLVALAPPPAPEPAPAPLPEDPKLPQHFHPDNPDGAPVWWDSTRQEWRTSFPAPEGFLDFEEGVFGDPDYERALTPEEEEVMALEEEQDTELAERRARESNDRDRWFGFTREAAPCDTGDDAPDAPPTPSTLLLAS
ncbi:hypothetical protein ACG3SL_02225 [Sphingomonas sp. CJ20]